MRFTLTEEQHGFGRSLDDLLSAAQTAAVVRSWADGDHDPGLKLVRRLADLGVNGLLVPESAGGLGATEVEMVVALEALGRHAVPGPWVETAFLTGLVVRLPGLDGRDELLAAVAEGTEVVTVAAPAWTPYALDADIAGRVLLVDDGLHLARPGELVRSVDPARRLFRVSAERPLGQVPGAALAAARDVAALACSAQLLGLGEALLASSVGYVKQRRQFGRAIGEYQALKHALADVRIGLDFARPLVYGAAVTGSSRDASAAKVAASEAAYGAARAALQVHGAIGYTAEHDLSLWLLKVRALVGAWGSPGDHRARILSSLVEPVETGEA
jgi:alkylation response protein AidB-like acyl-CoA dehydrogenase